MISVEVEV